jgi:hypothetical protein
MSRYTTLERQIFEERKTSAITEALNGRTFVGSTPEQRSAAAVMVRRLLLDEFETSRDGSGALVVREKGTGRPAADVLPGKLSSAEFAIFFAPSTTGGSGSQGSTTSNPNGGGSGPQPGSLEAIVADWQKRTGPYQGVGLHGKK